MRADLALAGLNHFNQHRLGAQENFLEVGPYVFDILDGEWYEMSGISAPDQIYWSVEYIPELMTVRFGTYGRGIWDFTLNQYQDMILGDVNSDEVINILDVVLTVAIVLGQHEPLEYELWAADVNEDGNVNVIDIVGIIYIIMDI